MILIGDYFALLLISILCLFYFESKFFLTAASKYFASCLVLTASTALLDILATNLLLHPGVPPPINIAINTLYFIVNLLTTSAIALVLFSKILEHVYDEHCMKRAKKSLIILFSIYLAFVITNIWTGWLFYFDANGIYQRGPLNAIGYFTTILQMVLVVICYVKNRKNVTKSMKRSLIQSFPIAIFCISIQIAFPNVLLNGLIMTLVILILFLNFQNQRPGVHTLTKLNDRHRFFKYLEDCIAGKVNFKIYFISIKNLESINQKYGHKSGDEVLYLFAFALEKLLRNSLAFHMDSTSFSLVITKPSEKKDDEDHLNKLYDFLNEGISFANERIFLEYTIVEHALQEKHVDATEFYEELEYGIDIAEQQGTRYLLYNDSMTIAMHRKQYLISRLEKIDRDHGFEVWFQPIRCMTSNQFCSMEALVRLREPNDTMISPAEFIPIAEQTDMIDPITGFVIDETCRMMSKHKELSTVSASINLPMKQLLDPEFETRLNRIVDLYQIDHRRICLEFTERVMLNDFERTKDAMQSISANGYRFFLDDFGTGLSNFNCLLQLPFENIKLDRSLTSTVTDPESDVGLVSMLTKLFHRMDLTVIAEGVETVEQVEILHNYGIDKIQGYYYAAPMNEKKLIDFYRQNPLN